MERQVPTCSYGTACFRKNPAHFRQLSHPHLEKLLAGVTGSEIHLPEKLDFPCTNRTLVREQLEILHDLKQRTAETGETSQSKGEAEVSRQKSDEVQPNKQGAVRDRSTGERNRTRCEILQKMEACGAKLDYVPESGDFAVKWLLAAPYHIFYTAVQKSRETWKQPLSVTLFELLDRSLGEIVLSLHLNFVVDFGWLVAQYLLAGQVAKMVVFYGQTEEIDLPATIEAHEIKCPTSFGCHHSKVSILQYKDGGIRIIVSTANLYKDDWDYRTQGLWMSPHLPRLAESAQATDGESPTGFKKDFLSYLHNYDRRMDQFKAIVKRADCSSINVAFVASVPGNYSGDDIKWGHKRLAKILKDHASIPENEPRSTIIAQSSSLGSLGPNYGSWVTTDPIASMSNTKETKKTIPEFKFIFPTIENYKQSYDMREGACCLCYNLNQHSKQEWIQRYMYKWKADQVGRTRAIPHIKSYTRISADEKRIWWFVLGSANFSKAAWGYHRGRSFCILNYESSVVFLPKFVTAEKDFPITEDPSRSSPTFPIHYDLPLTPYSKDDGPFVSDFFKDTD